MWGKLIMMIVRNMMRSRTRMLISILGCTLAAFVMCFFLAAENSLIQLTDTASQDANLVIRQKDRY